MTVDEVKALMFSSSSEEEWLRNADKVIKAFGGYPGWWYSEIIDTLEYHRLSMRLASKDKEE